MEDFICLFLCPKPSSMLSLHSVRCFSNLALQVLTIRAYTDSRQVVVILSTAGACISSSERIPGCLQTESSNVQRYHKLCATSKACYCDMTETFGEPAAA